MRERVEDFGGKLEIASSEQGTRVTAAIPVEAAQALSATTGNEPRKVGPVGVKKASSGGFMAKRAGVN